jgi:hypothetical protein
MSLPEMNPQKATARALPRDVAQGVLLAAAALLIDFLKPLAQIHPGPT